MPGGQPRSFQTLEALQQGIDGYYQDCKDNPIKFHKHGAEIEISEPLTVSGLASFLDVSRETLHQYSRGTYGDEYSDAIKVAIAKIERDKVAKAMLGIYDRSICIFDLKNNHSWKDQQAPEEGDYVEPVKVEFAIIDGRKQDDTDSPSDTD